VAFVAVNAGVAAALLLERFGCGALLLCGAAGGHAPASVKREPQQCSGPLRLNLPDASVAEALTSWPLWGWSRAGGCIASQPPGYAQHAAQIQADGLR
jgi:hypothetical protein